MTWDTRNSKIIKGENMLILLLLVIFCVFIMHQGVKPQSRSSGTTVSRSVPKTYPPELIECGNCRGTGWDGFGLMPDSFECGACNGKGCHKIDKNAKIMKLSDFMKKYKE